MNKDSKLKISEATLKDYEEIVELYNKNQVYQFSNGVPLSVRDLDLTMKIKEVSNLFLLKDHDKLIGTSAFFKFITHECLDKDSSFSGYLLIDSKNRSGQAISFLYKNILERITQLGFSNLYTEISKYNKPSLSLSKLNGFKEYHETYEDFLHHRSLRSNLPKLMRTFRISKYHGKEYDLSTFKILDEVENFSQKETEIKTIISEEEIVFRVQDTATLPYYLKMDLFKLEIMSIDDQYILRVDFLSDRVREVRVKFVKYGFVILTREKSSVKIRKRSNKCSIQASIVTEDGNIDVQLERLKNQSSHKNIILKNTFQGYDLSVTPDGNLIFSREGRIIFEDSFLLFSRPPEARIRVKEGVDNIKIQLKHQGLSITKNIEFIDNERVFCSYLFNTKARKFFPELLKQGFKIHCQEYLIENAGVYQAYTPGSNPIEHDDFIRADHFEEKSFTYYSPDEEKEIRYTPFGKGSNQMQFRPLSVIESTDLTDLVYHFTISRVSRIESGINSEEYGPPLNYQKTTSELLNCVLHAGIEEERNYGGKRVIANREIYPATNLVLSHNQITLPKDNVPLGSDLYSISFDYKIRGGIEQVSCGRRFAYENKSHILENIERLLVYDRHQDRYLEFFAKKGIFYSYRENNNLKVRCIFTTRSSYPTNISITEYKRSEENEYNL